MSTDQPKLDWPIRAVIDATNKADNKAFVAAFAKDGAVNDWGHVHSGRSEISAWDKAENTGTGRQLKVRGVSRLAGEVLVLVEITDTEGEVSRSTFTFRLKGDRVGVLEIG